MTARKKTAYALLAAALALAAWYALCLPRELFTAPRSTTLLDRNGVLMGARIADDGQWRLEESDHVPDKFAKAIVCYEDKRFRFHPGVDPLSMIRAISQNLRQGRVVSGGSTLTMQTIRLSRGDRPRNLGEKAVEAILATRLELRCSKKEILLMYASNAPFGGNVVGLDAAAWRYFGRNPDELSWAESAMLAVLPNAPSLIHPGKNRERLLAKRNSLLDKMMRAGILDAVECELAKEEELPEKPHPMPDMAYHLMERLRAENGSGAFVSTLDRRLQERVNNIAAKYFRVYHTNMVDNMGILVADVHSGEVLAYYGNTRGCAPGIRGADVDMITAQRSSGSTLKPLLYAAMLQDGLILPTTLIKDTPYSHRSFSPKNYSNSFEGAVPANEVIARSLNVPCVRMLEQYGPDRFLDLLHQMGFSMPFSADHYGLSLILGGAEISLEELVTAYCRLGAQISDDTVRKHLKTVMGPEKRQRKVEVPLGMGASWLCFEALSGANRPEEESSWMEFRSGGKVAWKTGTSWGNRDAWSIGLNADYAVGVWVGNSDGEGRAMTTGVGYAAPVMFEVFSALPTGSWFDCPYDDLVPVEICRESGLPAGMLCPHRDTIMAPPCENMPQTCTYHKMVHTDKDGRYQVNSSCCSIDEMVSEVRFVLPPAQEWYYMKKHLDYIPLPPKHPLFNSADEDWSPIEIIYPHSGVTVVTTRGFDSIKKGAVFKAAHSDPDATLFWHLDDSYLGSTRETHEMMVQVPAGKHALTVVDGNGSMRSVVFYGE